MRHWDPPPEMASSQLETSGIAADEFTLWRGLGARLAREAAQQRALAKAMVDESRADTKFQLDSTSRTFQETLRIHSKNAERSMEAACQQLRKDLQEKQDAALRRLEGQVREDVAGERLAVQEALQAVAEMLRRERAQMRAELQQGGASALQSAADPDGRPGAGPAQRPAAPAEAVLVTHSHLAEALSQLREDMREEMRVQMPAAPAASAAELEEGTTPAPTAGPAPQPPRAPLCLSPPGGAGGGCGPGPAAGRTAEAPPGEEAEPDGQGVVRVAIDKQRLDAEEFSFHESIWDAVMLIGNAHFGLFASIFTIVALLINVAMQILMLFIINDNLTQPPVSEDDIQQLEYWRFTVAHNIKYVDQFSWESLAKRVCEFKFAPMSASPIRWLEAINGYIPRQKDRTYFDPPPLKYWMNSEVAGEVMCCVALAIWWMTVLQELYSIVDMMMAVRLLPKGRTVFSTTGEGHRLEAASSPRRFLIGAVVALRVGICCLLAMSGTMYLVATISVSDLILNAVALEIVLNLDELVFSVMAPVSVRKLIRSMEPLPAGRTATCRGLDCKPIFALLVGIVAMVCMVKLQLNPLLLTLERARSAICDGNLEFVAGVDNAGMMWAAEPLASADVTSTYPYRAMRHVVETPDAAWDGTDATGEWLTLNYGHGVSEGSWSVVTLVNTPVEEISGLFNAACKDVDGSAFSNSGAWIPDDFWRVALEIMKDSYGIPTDISSCDDVASFCDVSEEAGIRARQYCPETCGCNDPTSNTSRVSASLGCPKSCRFSDMYHAKLNDLNCSDYSPEEPQTINGTDVQSVFESGSGIYYLNYYYDFQAIMQKGGCPEAVREYRSTGVGDLCEEKNSYGVRPITLMCPETCRCDQTGALLCPPACGLS